MSVEFISMKCPECGASFNLEKGRQECFCSYCGAKILVNNQNEYVFRHIDEAEIKQAEVAMKYAENEQLLRLKQLEISNQRREEVKKEKSTKAVLGIGLITLGILLRMYKVELALLAIVLFIIGIVFLFKAFKTNYYGIDNDIEIRKIKIPDTAVEYNRKNYKLIEQIIKGAGFTNVETIPLDDLTTGFLKKSGTVESIIIDGQPVSSGKKYLSNSLVVISYHSFSK